MEKLNNNLPHNSKTEVFARRARVDQAVGLCYRKKRNFLDNLTLEKPYPVFCVIEKCWCFVCFDFRPHRKRSATIFMYAHGKLDLTFV